jgi:4-hydroxy-3-methylbut-2-enyl diphosphate reductase
VIGTEEEARSFSGLGRKRLCIVSQTTFNYKNFDKLVEIIEKVRYDGIDILNTVCNATEERQSEARKIARQAECMIVIGGSHSSNTRKLYEICKRECANTYYIQTLKDLDIQRLPSRGCVGITAGASTPKKFD